MIDYDDGDFGFWRELKSICMLGFEYFNIKSFDLKK